MHSRTVTLECAGNGRSFLTPKVKGVPWDQGAVSTAEWSGIPLGAVLESAGVKDSAREVIFEGADFGELKDDPKPAGTVRFARSIPLEKALQDVLLALQMNGAELPARHGFPLRAIVPGWYGMASVKWLTRLIVSDRPFNGFYQTMDYSIFSNQYGLATQEPITQMQVKSQIARPARGEAVPPGKPYRVYGAAWAGENAVAAVDFSADLGRTWHAAKLLDAAKPFTWCRFEHSWDVPSRAGKAIIWVRATDSAGRVQPLERDRNLRTYVIHHVQPTEVEIR
jgi:DMSO/TMAO reductase YedYZ molybdopterin-dependent catalytic subunit